MKNLRPSPFCTLLALSLLFFSNPSNVVAQERSPAERKTYIVHLEPPENSLASTDDHSSDLESWYRSFLPTTTTITSSADEPRMVYMYTKLLTGFAAKLTEQELSDMSMKTGFLHAYPNRFYTRKTTRTPSFLGLNTQTGIWKDAHMGKGIIIGVLDGGVFPDHPSFSDANMPPPPPKWRGRCEYLNGTSHCNNKIIGARVFLGGATGLSPIDEDGHGTHVASTAAGAFVAGAEVLGQARGVAAGMAPLAHIANYKVCGIEECADADVLAAMEAAISDGVDVLSLSLGDVSRPFYEDSLAIGAFRAVQAGVFVSTAAGNSGPAPATLSNEAPWLLTVAASTMDRSVKATVRLGNGLEFDGESVFQPKEFGPALLPLVYAGASGRPDASFCGNGSFHGVDIKGKIVLCERGGGIGRIAKGEFVKSAGGAAMILMNDAAGGFSTSADVHVVPASHVGFADGSTIRTYIKTRISPTATIVFKGTVFEKPHAPSITSFSSRGPSIACPGILKPDVTGPGANVLAAWPPTLGISFNIISGTSMSTPHLSGVAGLLKGAHPDWSPAAIKSAIMTTADVVDRTGNLIEDERRLAADMFAVGSGHVNPTRANDPGLVYDIAADDYMPYLCGLGYTSSQVQIVVGKAVDCSTVMKITEGELNYPSVSAAFGDGTYTVTFERTVRNVGEAKSSYWAVIEAPKGVVVSVRPKLLQFWEVNQEQKFKVTLTTSSSGGGAVQGSLKWVSAKRTVRSPVSVTFKGK